MLSSFFIFSCYMSDQLPLKFRYPFHNVRDVSSATYFIITNLITNVTPNMARFIDRCVTLNCSATFLVTVIVSSPYVLPVVCNSHIFYVSSV